MTILLAYEKSGVMHRLSFFIIVLLFPYHAYSLEPELREGTTRLKGNYRIKYNYFQKLKKKGGLTEVGSQDLGESLDVEKSWKNSSFSEYVDHDYPKIIGMHQQNAPLGMFRSLELKTSQGNVYGLIHGLLRPKATFGIIWKTEDATTTKSFPAFSLTHTSTVKQCFTWESYSAPDFIEAAWIGNAIEKESVVIEKTMGKKETWLLPKIKHEAFSSSTPMDTFDEKPVFRTLEEKAVGVLNNGTSPFFSSDDELPRALFLPAGERLCAEFTTTETIGHAPTWTLESSLHGIRINPIYLHKIKPPESLDPNHWLQEIETTQSLQTLIKHYAYLSNLLRQKKLDVSISFQLRQVLFKRIKESKNKLRDFIITLARDLNSYQRSYALDILESEDKKIINALKGYEEIENKLSQLQWGLKESNATHLSTLFEAITPEVKKIAEDLAFQAERADIVKRSIHELLSRSKKLTSEELNSLFFGLKKISEGENNPLRSLMPDLEHEIQTANPERSHVLLEKIMDALQQFKVNQQKAISDIRDWLKQEAPAKIRGAEQKIQEIHQSTRNLIKQSLNRQKDLHTLMDIIQTDVTILFGERPWEKLE